MTTRDVEMLLCEPEYFSVDYEINPWMKVDEPVDTELAWRQWREFRRVLESLGVRVHLIDPAPGLPDMAFAGDGGFVFADRFITSNFRPKERRPEAERYRRWFAERGYTIEDLPSEVFFEGLGDLVLHERTVVAAHGMRTSRDALHHLRSLLPELDWIAELELVNPLYFHLGVSLSLLDEETGLYVPEAFSEASLEVIERMDHHMIPLGEADAHGFAPNTVVVGRDVIVHFCSDALRADLESRGFRVIVCDVSEFVKAGGGTRCLVLPFAR